MVTPTKRRIHPKRRALTAGCFESAVEMRKLTGDLEAQVFRVRGGQRLAGLQIPLGWYWWSSTKGLNGAFPSRQHALCDAYDVLMHGRRARRRNPLVDVWDVILVAGGALLLWWLAARSRTTLIELGPSQTRLAFTAEPGTYVFGWQSGAWSPSDDAPWYAVAILSDDQDQAWLIGYGDPDYPAAQQASAPGLGQATASEAERLGRQQAVAVQFDQPVTLTFWLPVESENSRGGVTLRAQRL